MVFQDKHSFTYSRLKEIKKEKIHLVARAESNNNRNSKLKQWQPKRRIQIKVLGIHNRDENNRNIHNYLKQ